MSHKDAEEAMTNRRPEYLRAHGHLGKPEELTQHHCLLFRVPTTGRERPWEYKTRGRLVALNLAPRMVMDEGEALVRTAAEHVGLIQEIGRAHV